MTAPLSSVRVELWTDLPAAGGTRVAFLVADAASVRWPDGTDYRARLSAELVPTPAFVQAYRALLATGVQPVLRLVPLAADGSDAGTWAVTHWRVLTHELTLADPVRRLALTAEHPFLDWGAVGRVRQATGGGLPRFDLSGAFTPAEALQVALDFLAARGRGYWVAGPIGRTDPKPLSIAGVTPQALAERIAELWGLEIELSHAAGETQHVIALPTRAGAGAGVPVLRLGHALQALTVAGDAHDLANAVTILGADGATLGGASEAAPAAGQAPDAWPLTAVNGTTGDLSLADPDGGPGPIQIDGQLVGNYVQKPDGTRVAITHSLAGDGVTSVVRVAVGDGVGLAVGDEVEFRADAAGARLLAVEDPTVPAAQRVEITLERGDLTGARNYIRDARAKTAPATVGSGWRHTNNGSVGTVTSSALAAPPAGCAIDDGTGLTRRVRFSHAGEAFDSPITNAIEPVAGDDTVTFRVWYYLASAGIYHLGPTDHSPTVLFQVYDAVAGAVAWTRGGIPLPEVHYQGQTWVTFEFTTTLDAARRLRARAVAIFGDLGGGALDVPSLPEGHLDVYFAAMQLTRHGAPASLVERAEARALRQAANAHLLWHRRAVETPRATAEDRYARDPVAYADQRFTRGGDLRVVAPEYGIDLRARLLGVERGLEPGAAELALVALPDAATAAQLAATAPTRPLANAERIRRDIRA